MRPERLYENEGLRDFPSQLCLINFGLLIHMGRLLERLLQLSVNIQLHSSSLGGQSSSSILNVHVLMSCC